MRVIIEMSEAESRTASVERHVIAAQGAGERAMQDAPAPDDRPALDAGGPSAALLVALGAAASEEEAEMAEGTARQGGTSAGAAPDWLTEILSRARD